MERASNEEGRRWRRVILHPPMGLFRVSARYSVLGESERISATHTIPLRHSTERTITDSIRCVPKIVNIIIFVFLTFVLFFFNTKGGAISMESLSEVDTRWDKQTVCVILSVGAFS